jgi:hypothetical protein
MKKRKCTKRVFLLSLGLHGSTVCMVDMVGKTYGNVQIILPKV